MGAQRYRWRQVMPVAISEAALGPESPELAEGRRLHAQGRVELQRSEELSGGRRLVAGVAERVACEAILDADGAFSKAKCACAHFRAAGLRKAPCRHGPGVSTVLADRRWDVELLHALGLPVAGRRDRPRRPPRGVDPARSRPVSNRFPPVYNASVSWLARFFGSPKQKTLEQILEESAAELDAAPLPEERLPDAPGAPPEAWAKAMELAPEALDGVGPPLFPEEAATAEAVLEHFEDHRPGPASFPSIALKILEQVRDPRVDAAGLARTIEMDAALSSGLLVLANSAVFRGLSRVETLREAVTRLGLGEVARTAAALSTRSLYRSVQTEFELFGPIWNRLFYHAVTVARAGADLARLRKLGDPDRVFIGGMLHDVGKSLALRSLAALLLEDEVRQLDLPAVERVLHDVHVPIGVEAHREWGLPANLAAIAEWHHLPDIAAGPEQTELHVVRLTSALELLRTAPGLSPAAPAEVIGSARALGLGPARVRALRTALAEHGAWVKMLFGEETGGPAAAH
ncbi:MAG TPA: HDOD domain-containing protein [Anaeromyxobacter sp.]|nr:HDOD domain-containing protein [Anaeromyxobacter sp.]